MFTVYLPEVSGYHLHFTLPRYCELWFVLAVTLFSYVNCSSASWVTCPLGEITPPVFCSSNLTRSKISLKPPCSVKIYISYLPIRGLTRAQDWCMAGTKWLGREGLNLSMLPLCSWSSVIEDICPCLFKPSFLSPWLLDPFLPSLLLHQGIII